MLWILRSLGVFFSLSILGCFFLKIRSFLLTFRTLLSICLSLSCRFPGSPPKWFTLFWSSEEFFWQYLLQPQHSASSCCCACVGTTSVEHSQVCLLERHSFYPEVLTGLYTWWHFSKEIEIRTSLQLWNQAQTRPSLVLHPPQEKHCFCLFGAVPGKVSSLQSLQHSHKVLFFRLMVFNLQVHSQ